MTPTAGDDVRDLLALHLVPGVGPRLTASLLERFGSAAAVRQASAAELREVPYLGEPLAAKLAASLSTIDVDAEFAKMVGKNVKLCASSRPSIPRPWPPSPIRLIFSTFAGPANRAISKRWPSLVRAGAPLTANGLLKAWRRIWRGPVTPSSAAWRGIDGAAHRGALKAGGRTFAVLAGGLSRIYPPEHNDLALQVEAAGALVSEAAMDQEPLPNMFPTRNRIISGLARAVVLVEAAEKSGALITAEHAAHQGRPVFAVPGPVDGEASAGTNALIRTGAILCRGARDVLEELDGLAGMQAAGAGTASPLPPALDPVEMRLWEFLANEPRLLDDIVQHLGLSVPKITGMLLTLEMKKIVRRLPGNRYERM